jgi:hypothetical protein
MPDIATSESRAEDRGLAAVGNALMRAERERRVLRIAAWVGAVAVAVIAGTVAAFYAIEPQRGADPPLISAPQQPAAPATRVRIAVVRPDGSDLSAPEGAHTPYLVQVATQKSERDVIKTYRALQAKYPSVLGNRGVSVRRTDLGEKGALYRAELGPFATADEANAFCTSLKVAGGECAVVTN